jgi:hypothetical protein
VKPLFAVAVLAVFLAASTLGAGAIGLAAYTGGVAFIELSKLLPQPPSMEPEPEEEEGEPVFERLLQQLAASPPPAQPPPPPTFRRPYRHRFMAPDRIHDDEWWSEPMVGGEPLY